MFDPVIEVPKRSNPVVAVLGNVDDKMEIAEYIVYARNNPSIIAGIIDMMIK